MLAVLVGHGRRQRPALHWSSNSALQAFTLVPGISVALPHVGGSFSMSKPCTQVRCPSPPARPCDQRIRHPAGRAGSQEARPVALTATRQSTLAGFPLRLRDRAGPRVGVFEAQLRQVSLLVCTVRAVPDLGLGSRAAEAGVVQALA